MASVTMLIQSMQTIINFIHPGNLFIGPIKKLFQGKLKLINTDPL